MPRSLAFWRSLWILVIAAGPLAACATGSVLINEGEGGGGGAPVTGSTGGASPGSQASSSSGSGSGSSSGGNPSSGSGTGMARSCPTGQFVKSIDAKGVLACAPIDAATRAAVNADCAVYLGQQDNCSGCSSPPTKWGFVSADTCANGAGADSTCSLANLGGQDVMLFGLNTDGDVNADDKFYLGFSCGQGSVGSKPGPCDASSFATGVEGAAVTCSPASRSILGYVRESCSLYFGQRDSCDGCAGPPARWGRVGTTSCDIGVGAGNTCALDSLGETDVTLLGLDLDGDADGNDKFYLGVHCLPPKADTSVGKGSCPAGQLVAGIEADGSLRCVSPAPTVATFIAERCSLTFGFNDSCNGCVTPPAKWGQVRDGFCENGAGADNTCSSAMLGSETISLFGLNSDGDVDGNDKFYIGLRCD
jgi:hypothetical protein